MSKGRLISSYVLTAAVVLAAAWFTTVSFPLEASPRVEVQQSATSQGVVRVELAPNLSEPLRSKLRDRLAAFQGRPYTLEIRAEILRAAREIDPTAGIPMMLQAEAADGSVVSRFVVGVGPIPLATQGPMHIDVSGLPEPLRSTMEARLAPFEGQMYTPDLQAEITKAAKDVDERASVGLRAEPASAAGPARVTVLIVASPGTQATSLLPPATGKRITVSGAEQQKKLVSQARPQYPPPAREARIQGMVRFTVLVGVDGRVAALRLVSGHPLLVPAAEEAVKQWTYEPTLLNGEPVEVLTDIDLNFTLQ